PIPDQCQCGGSWAFAVAMSLNITLRLWTSNQVTNAQDQPLVLPAGKLLRCHFGSIQEYNLLKDAIAKLSKSEFDQSKMYDRTNPIGCDQLETLLGGWQYVFRFGVFASPCVTNADFGICN